MHLPINLWAPAAGMPLGLALATALLLGVIHGITPDEHTWPITFSYAIGSFSTRAGLAVALVFSAAFTLQRAIGSELAYLALAPWMRDPTVQQVTYLVVGAAMTAAGLYVTRGHDAWHLGHGRGRRTGAGRAGGVTQAAAEGAPQRLPARWALVHGFIAGWGFGAFALILYTVLAPAMPNAAVAWLPGFCFGVGTMAVQAAIGAAFGFWSRRIRLPAERAQAVAGRVAGRTLLWGGLAFGAVGAAGLLWPGLGDIAITTPLQIHNLHHLGVGFALVIVIVCLIGFGSLVQETARERARLHHDGIIGTRGGESAAAGEPPVAPRASVEASAHRVAGGGRPGAGDERRRARAGLPRARTRTGDPGPGGGEAKRR